MEYFALITERIIPEQVWAEIAEWGTKIVGSQHSLNEDQVVESFSQPEARFRIRGKWKVSEN